MSGKSVKMLKKLQALNQRMNTYENEVQQDIMKKMHEINRSRGYRADLKLITSAKNTTGTFSAYVKFDHNLGYPSERDVMSIVSRSYPKHQIDWETIEVNATDGMVAITLAPSVEVLPLESIKKIPSEFISIGAGIYKRAADSSGKVMEIWTLKKTDNGLSLFRNQDDVEVTADNKDGFKTGDVVNTPQGPGRIMRFDDLGNAFVQVAGKQHLVAADELEEYDVDKEKAKLVDYYTEAYGDRAYAELLVKKYNDPDKQK